MSKDLIIDFESLGQGPHAALLSCGLLVVDTDDINPDDLNGSFNRMIEKGAHWKFKIANQVKEYQRTIDKSTVDWWSTQGKSASTILMPQADDYDLSDLPVLIKAFLFDNGYSSGKCYTRGMIDSTWLQSVENTIGTMSGIKWWNYRDIRTFVDVLTGSTNGYLPKEYKFYPPNLIKHNALHDCALDAIQMYIAATIGQDNPICDDDIPY